MNRRRFLIAAPALARRVLVLEEALEKKEDAT